MSRDEARAILLRAFAARSNIPQEWLALLIEPEPRRKPIWRRLLNL